jgi:hypothetical protein
MPSANAAPTADWLVDSMPVPVCRFGRGGFVRNFRGQAAFGYDSLQKQAYYGFRLHLRVSRDGVILASQLAPANASDLELLPELGLPAGTTGIGDRNYWSPAVAAELAAAGVRLPTPSRTKKHDPDPTQSRRLRRPRWRVETVNSQLAGRYHRKRVRARELGHLCHRVIRKILSHTVAVWLNLTLGLDPRRFSDCMAA